MDTTDPILRLVGASPRRPAEIRWAPGGFVASFGTAPAGPATSSLRSCIESLLRAHPGFRPEECGTLEITRLRTQDGLAPRQVADCFSGLEGFEPTGHQWDLHTIVLTVDGIDFVSVRFDDSSFEVIPLADIDGEPGLRVLAWSSSFEAGSRTAGVVSSMVGRLPSGHVLMHWAPDEEPGDMIAFRRPMSDVEAVAMCLDWVYGANPHDTDIAKFIYRDGGTLRTAADLDPELSDSLEISMEINLTPQEFEELWTRLG